jgi:hypothetical protein
VGDEFCGACGALLEGSRAPAETPVRAPRYLPGSQGEPRHCAELSTSCLAAGDVATARELAERGAAVGQKIGARLYEARAQLAVAAAALTEDGTDAARTALERCEHLLRKTSAKSWLPFLHEGRAELARVEADGSSREHELREALRLYTEMGATGHAERVARELGSQ